VLNLFPPAASSSSSSSSSLSFRLSYLFSVIHNTILPDLKMSIYTYNFLLIFCTPLNHLTLLAVSSYLHFRHAILCAMLTILAVSCRIDHEVSVSLFVSPSPYGTTSCIILDLYNILFIFLALELLC
jgi:hypothetical protein